VNWTIIGYALQKGIEKVIEEQPIQTDSIFLRVQASSPDARCKFSYSIDGNRFEDIGNEFKAKPGKWIGAKVGLLCTP
jgi:hypothetical protein